MQLGGPRTMMLRLTVAMAGILACSQAKELAYDSVVPLPETEDSTNEYSLALQFKPQLLVDTGCHPYPVVDADGNTNAGLSLVSLKSCQNPSLGSQIYARASVYEGSYAIMYAWYFPRDRRGAFGHRHAWEHAILWLWGRRCYDRSRVSRSRRCVKFKYEEDAFSHYVNVTTEAGEFQDLVVWEDMPNLGMSSLGPKAARTALNLNDFGEATVPFNEENFLDNLEGAYPF
ncbi:hypothetical protein F443_15110 [Phytophthora nicotianae P1569]|uniref:Necrosis inducing-like protein NPP1 type n=1 Tax=Phytophthora nicotianae P1569 TaxID=1317065 RepID=V9EK06_PHYNI|nr:hypothetical protein F443_15110 [Phytophthora nicotianae P1569]